ncbi:MAG: hypothetical protein ACYT04_35835 [Nostoc sp.]
MVKSSSATKGFESYSPMLVGKGLFLLGLYCTQLRNAISLFCHSPGGRSPSSEIRGLKTLEQATNQSDDLFQLGDRIQVIAPWGKNATAEIVTLYQGNGGDVWA